VAYRCGHMQRRLGRRTTRRRGEDSEEGAVCDGSMWCVLYSFVMDVTRVWHMCVMVDVNVDANANKCKRKRKCPSTLQ
jgi:hypothetical protein